ncbi:MAG: hypothetical protein L0G70_10195, partial [Rubrobacter sp.]|nr:hypothetical protein [Rubrobacter sp.]
QANSEAGAEAESGHETTVLAGGTLPAATPPVLVIEGGEVSERNILRQGYLPQDAGRNKALVLSERYSAAYGLAINAYPHYLGHDTEISDLVCDGAVVVGCVDNAASRKVLDEKLREFENIVYLDSGNGAVAVPDGEESPSASQYREIREGGWDGQVTLGARKGAETILPFPADVFPELVEVEDPDDRHPETIPCGEVTASAPQRMLTNLMAANVVLSYLYPLLTEGVVLNCRSVFDARQGYIRSTPAMDELEEFAV